MNKIKVTAQQRANAIEARDVMWPSVPPENVMGRLRTWRNDEGAPSCGSLACFGGWCAWWPEFQAQGVSAHPEHGWPVMTCTDGCGVADALFGHSRLFDVRNCAGEADETAPLRSTDHELVAHRLNWLIENSEVAP